MIRIALALLLAVTNLKAQAPEESLLLLQWPASTAVSSPTDIPNLYRWYDAYYQSNYSGGDLIDSSKPWTNRVYGTDNLTGSGSARPSYETSVLNGGPGILFDGSDDVMSMTGIGSQSQLTVVGVFRITQAHSTTTMGMLDDSGGSSKIWISATPGPNFTLRVDDAGATLGESDAISIEWTNAMMATWAIDGTDVKFWMNGTNYGTDTDMGSIGSFTLNRMGNAAGIQFKGYMHEWLIYTNYKASATQVEQLWSNYVSNKWFAPESFTPTDESGLVLWHKADTISASNGDQISQWDDSSGNSYHATQGTQVNRPHYLTGQLNSLPALRFYGTNHFLNLSNVLNGLGLSAAEAFIVLKVAADPAATDNTSGFWSLTSSTEDSHIPYSDGNVYDSFGTDGRKSTGNPTLSMASWRLYNVQSAASAWTNRIDGAVHFGTGVNAVGFSQTTHLTLGVSWSSGTYMMDGWIAEFIFYDHVLSAAVRDQVEAYIATKYGLTIP
jgi:hypothetical protein